MLSLLGFSQDADASGSANWRGSFLEKIKVQWEQTFEDLTQQWWPQTKKNIANIKSQTLMFVWLYVIL